MESCECLPGVTGPADHSTAMEPHKSLLPTHPKALTPPEAGIRGCDAAETLMDKTTGELPDKTAETTVRNQPTSHGSARTTSLPAMHG